MYLSKYLTRYSISLLLLLGTALPSHAQTSLDVVDQMIEGTGIDKLISATPRLAIAALKQSAFAVEDPTVNSQLNGAFTNAFTVQKIKQDINQQLHHNMQQSLADDYLKLLANPVWKEISKLERASSDPANSQDMITFAEKIKHQPASQSRMFLIKRLDDANRTSEFSINLQLAFFRSVFSAINPVLDADMKIDSEELEKMQDEVRKSIAENIKQHVQLSYLYAFKTINDAALEDYVKLSEGDVNRNSNQHLTKAIIDAIDKASERAAQTMRRNVDSF